jgi:hypothetical protein
MFNLNQSLICKNGHYLKCYDGKFCPNCGAETIDSCPNCSEKIPFLDQSAIIQDYKIPSYCFKCGSPYPWTTTLLDTARTIVHEDELLQDEQITEWCDCFPDIICQTPKTQLALIRYKKMVDKAASTTVNALKDLLVDVVSETIKKQLFDL